MNKEEILEKSRAENRNKDIYEKEVLKQASTSAVIVMMVLATIFFCRTDICRRWYKLGYLGTCFQCKYDNILGEIYKTAS